MRRRSIVLVLPEDDDTAPTITSSANVNNVEGVPLSHVLTADEFVTWTIVGGVDAAHFEVVGSILRWAENGTQDYEDPQDDDQNNIYLVTVRATDSAENFSEQNITVTVQEAVGDITAPTITSSASVNVEENAMLAHTLTADEEVTWSIVGGVDAAHFEIVGSILRWDGNGTQDYEDPQDDDQNNIYLVTVRATDLADNWSEQNITVTVTDVDDDEDPVPDYVAYWAFEEGTGSLAADSSDNDNDGTLNGPTWVAGQVGDYALNFAASNSQRVEVPHSESLGINGEISIACWVYVESFPGTGTQATIVSKGFGSDRYPYFLELHGGDLRVGSYRDDTFTAFLTTWTPTWGTGEWHHVVGVYDGTAWKLYSDGFEVSSTNESSGALTDSNTQDIWVGGAHGLGRYFNGMIDDVRIYDRALSPVEIAALADWML